jgi:hypothetical protein
MFFLIDSGLPIENASITISFFFHFAPMAQITGNYGVEDLAM